MFLAGILTLKKIRTTALSKYQSDQNFIRKNSDHHSKN